MPSSLTSSLQPPYPRHSHSIVAGHDIRKRHDVSGVPLSSSRQRQCTNAPSASPWLIPSPRPPRCLHVDAPLCRHVRLPVLSGCGGTWLSRYGSTAAQRLSGYGGATATSRLRSLPDWDRVPWHPNASTNVAARHARLVGPQPTATPPRAIPTAGRVKRVQRSLCPPSCFRRAASFYVLFYYYATIAPLSLTVLHLCAMSLSHFHLIECIVIWPPMSSFVLCAIS